MSDDVVFATLVALGTKVTLVFAAALAVDFLLLRRASAAARHLLWTLALGAVLLLPALGALLPAWRVVVPIAAARPVPTTAPVPAVSSVSGRMDVTRRRGAAEPSSVSPELRASAAPRELPQLGSDSVYSWREMILVVYAFGLALLLARVVLDRRAVGRLAHAATPVDDTAWTSLARALAAQLGLRREVALLRSANRTMPLTWGMLRPRVLLPVDADAWTLDRRRAVLLHELAHVARHDCLTQALAAVACAFYWPHPGAWWAAARLREERELACDDRALAQGVSGGDYAGQLLELARTLRTPRAIAAAAATMAATARPSHLERRLRAAIDRTRDRRAPGRRGAMLGTIAALALVAPLAALRPGAVEARALPASVPSAPAIAAAPVVMPATIAPVPNAGGTWTIRMMPREESRGDVPTVHVMFVTNGINTFYEPLASFDGLGGAVFAAGDTTLRFRLRRDAGTFDFAGTFHAGTGNGRFEFTPDAAFGDSLARRGMARPTAEQQLSLAKHGVQLAFLDTLAAYGYATPTTAELVRVGMTSVDGDHVREMASLGYRVGRIETLVYLHNLGVDPPDVRRFNALAGRTLTVAELLRAHEEMGNVPSAPAAPAATAAPAPPDAPAVPVPDSVPPRGEESTPRTGRWVVHSTRDGWVDLEMFWSDDTNWRRWYRLSSLHVGDGALALEQDAGTFEMTGGLRDGRGSGALRFTPHREFVATLRTLGIRDADKASDHNLKNLAWGELSTATLRELQEVGYRSLTLDEIQAMGIFGVTSRFARTANAGEATPMPVDELIDLRRRTNGRN